MPMGLLTRGDPGALLRSIHAEYDTVVVGGGLAGLCAAITARSHGASVLLIEQAPPAFRGGDTRHARNCRVAHIAPSDFSAEAYTPGEMAEDVHSAAGESLDTTLVEAIATGTLSLPAWFSQQGVQLQRRLDGTIPWSRKTVFFLGGGKRALNALYHAVDRMGVDILYNSEVTELRCAAIGLHQIYCRQDSSKRRLLARTVVLCSGGYQGDMDWLATDWGEAARHFVLRGRQHSGHDILRQCLALGAMPAGNPLDCHLVAVDGRATAADGGIVTRVDGFDDGSVLDCMGRAVRPTDATSGKHRFAAWGRAIAACPGQVAYLIRKNDGQQFHRVVQFLPHPSANMLSREGLPEAVRVSPLVCIAKDTIIPLRPGITFTTYGLATDSSMKVIWQSARSKEDRRPAGIFAAGMIMAGSLIRKRYLSGLATSLSAVTGRIAGLEAARHALQR
jgi:tricarballylate dehydrogenase